MNNTATLALVPSEGTGEELGIKTVSLTELAAFDKQHYSRMGGRKPKIVPQELIDLAIQNNPLESIPRWQFTDEVKASLVFRENLPTLKNGFLQQQFLQLADLGITFESTSEQIEEAIELAKSQKNHLAAHLSSLRNAFISMQEVFFFLEFIMEKGKFEEKHLTSIHTICTAFTAIGDIKRKERFIVPIAKQCLFNRERYIMELPVVLSTDNLSELLLAFPVCFLSGLSARSEREDDPRPSEATKFLCNAGGGKSFAWFYQIYNRRDRNISDYKGPDPIPSDYLEFRTQLGQLIDLEIIATPYHEIASKEWADPSWQSSIDPVAFGLQKDIPFVTIFKRWSGNGIFPLIGDLMADTIDYLDKNKNKLRAFANPYWHKSGNSHGSLNGGDRLISFVEEIVNKFKQGEVFDFLRS